MGHMVCHLGDHLGAELQGVLAIFLERLKNEITRLTAVRTISLISASPLKVQYDCFQRTQSLLDFSCSYKNTTGKKETSSGWKITRLSSVALFFSPDRHVVHPARSFVCVGIFLAEEPAGSEARHAGVSDRAGHASRCQRKARSPGARTEWTSCSGGWERHARITGTALNLTQTHINHGPSTIHCVNFREDMKPNDEDSLTLSGQG